MRSHVTIISVHHRPAGQGSRHTEASRVDSGRYLQYLATVYRHVTVTERCIVNFSEHII